MNFESIKNYFTGVKAEWGKVSWPTRQQVLMETGVVIAVVIFFTLVVFLIDKLYIFLLGLIK